MDDRGPPHSTTQVRVRYAETDQMGVVYHANYLVYFELARVDLLAAAGIRYRDLEGRGFLLAVTEATCRYLGGARYDDPLAVEAWLVERGAARIVLAYRIRHEETSRVLVEGSTELACLGDNFRPRRMPDDVCSALDRLARGNVTP